MAKRRKTTYQKRKKVTVRDLLINLAIFCLVTAALAILNQTGLLEWDEVYHEAGLAESAPSVDTGSVGAGTVPLGTTQVHFIDVGQGDATLIEQDGEYILIDAGTASAREDLLNYLENLGVKELSLMVMTHSHADHIGSMTAVLEAVTVEKLLLPDFNLLEEMPTTQMFMKVLETASAQHVPTEVATVGTVYPLGGGQLEVISTGIPTDNFNDVSICTRYTAGSFAFVATGDAEEGVEQSILESGKTIEANLFKAGHHGSSSSNTFDFMKAMSPEMVVVSCGVDNKYGHPHDEVVETFDLLGIEVYRTDESGAVVVSYGEEDGMMVRTAHAA